MGIIPSGLGLTINIDKDTDMGGRQRFRPLYGLTFKHLTSGDQVFDGVVLGCGYSVHRNRFGNNPLKAILVVEDPGAEDGFSYLDEYDIQTLEDAMLRNRIAMGKPYYEDLDNYMPHLRFAKWIETVDQQFTSPEYHSGIHEIFNQIDSPIDTETPVEKKERPQMKASKIFSQVKDTTLNSAKAAGKLEFVGRTGLAVAKHEIGAVLPMIPKEFLDHPGSDVMVSLVVITLMASFAPDNVYAGTAAEAMSTVAFQNAMGLLNVPELAEKIVSGIGIERIKSLIDDGPSDD